MISAMARELAGAPIDDEPETEEERQAVAQSKEWLRLRGGKGIPHEGSAQRFRPDDGRFPAHGASEKGLSGPMRLVPTFAASIAQAPCGFWKAWRDFSLRRKVTSSC
jgi:hypothetical protein